MVKFSTFGAITGEPPILVGYVPAITMGTARCEQSDIARLTAARCGASLLWFVFVSLLHGRHDPALPSSAPFKSRHILGLATSCSFSTLISSDVHDPDVLFSVWLEYSLSNPLCPTLVVVLLAEAAGGSVVCAAV